MREKLTSEYECRRRDGCVDVEGRSIIDEEAGWGLVSEGIRIARATRTRERIALVNFLQFCLESQKACD